MLVVWCSVLSIIQVLIKSGTCLYILGCRLKVPHYQHYQQETVIRLLTTIHSIYFCILYWIMKFENCRCSRLGSNINWDVSASWNDNSRGGSGLSCLHQPSLASPCIGGNRHFYSKYTHTFDLYPAEGLYLLYDDIYGNCFRWVVLSAEDRREVRGRDFAQHWLVIGPGGSRDLNTGLWLAAEPGAGQGWARGRAASVWHKQERGSQRDIP